MCVGRQPLNPHAERERRAGTGGVATLRCRRAAHSLRGPTASVAPPVGATSPSRTQPYPASPRPPRPLRGAGAFVLSLRALLFAPCFCLPESGALAEGRVKGGDESAHGDGSAPNRAVGALRPLPSCAFSAPLKSPEAGALAEARCWAAGSPLATSRRRHDMGQAVAARPSVLCLNARISRPGSVGPDPSARISRPGSGASCTVAIPPGVRRRFGAAWNRTQTRRVLVLPSDRCRPAAAAEHVSLSSTTTRKTAPFQAAAQKGPR